MLFNKLSLAWGQIFKNPELGFLFSFFHLVFSSAMIQHFFTFSRSARTSGVMCAAIYFSGVWTFNLRGHRQTSQTPRLPSYWVLRLRWDSLLIWLWMMAAAGRVNQEVKSPLPFRGQEKQVAARRSDSSAGTAGSPESIQSFSVFTPDQIFFMCPAAAS